MKQQDLSNLGNRNALRLRALDMPVFPLRTFLFVIILISTLMLSLLVKAEQPAIELKEGPVDVRVLVDMSGSMKQNDPNNLRVPALELLIEMLPEGSQAGIWTFGKWVNMLVPPGEVNDEWRRNAKAKAQTINSHGLRTNIGEAMEQSMWQLQKDGPYLQSTILLTDGMVDIADDDDPDQQQKNAAEKNRILKELLPKLKELDTEVHTIALSENADMALLEQMAVSTDGLASVANSADDLIKIFLRTFDKAVPTEQVPLKSIPGSASQNQDQSAQPSDQPSGNQPQSESEQERASSQDNTQAQSSEQGTQETNPSQGSDLASESSDQTQGSGGDSESRQSAQTNTETTNPNVEAQAAETTQAQSQPDSQADSQSEEQNPSADPGGESPQGADTGNQDGSVSKEAGQAETAQENSTQSSDSDGSQGNAGDPESATPQGTDQAAQAESEAAGSEAAGEEAEGPRGQFTIDNAISEFTALVFYPKDGPKPKLKSPSGVMFEEANANENARWYNQDNFSLITISNPEAGDWIIEGEMDPNNRITVVSDVKLKVDGIPTNISPGDKIDMEIYLHEDGKKVTRKEFLDLMDVDLKVTMESGKSGRKRLSKKGSPDDGIYREKLYKLREQGTYELEVILDGKTFQRSRKIFMTMREPVSVEYSAVGDQHYLLKVIPNSQSIDKVKTRVIAKIKGPDGDSIIQAVRLNEEGYWESKIRPTKGDGNYDISLNIKVVSTDGRDSRQKPSPKNLVFPIPADFNEKENQSRNQQKAAAIKDSQKPEDKADEEAKPETPEEGAPETAEAEIAPDLAQKAEDGTAAEPAESDMTEETASEEESMSTTDQLLKVLMDNIIIAGAGLGALALIGGFLLFRKKKSASQDSGKMESPSDDLDSMGAGDDLEADFSDDFDLGGDEDSEDLSGAANIDASEDALEDLDDNPNEDEIGIGDDDLSGDDDLDDFGSDDLDDFGSEDAGADEPSEESIDTEAADAAVEQELEDAGVDFDEEFSLDDAFDEPDEDKQD